MNKESHLYFHSPCFDGIVSCVLAWDFLEATQGWVIQSVHAVNYDARPGWLLKKLNAPCGVVDFLYHPEASFWADHHLTTFLNEETKRHFEQRRNPWLIYDPQSDSCAKLLWNDLYHSLGYRNDRYKAMVEWADKIDSARYESVSEAILGDAPALRVNVSLEYKDEQKNGMEEYAETLVRLLRHQSLEEVSGSPEVLSRFEKARKLQENGLERFRKALAEKAAHLRHGEIVSIKESDFVVFDEESGIVVFKMDTGDVIFNRYTPYLLFPDARYSVGITQSSKGTAITAMRNPWREFPSVFLGRIFEEFRGGGHQRVGAVVLDEDRAIQAGSILQHVLDEIRREDSTRQGGAAS
ncbi:MAG: hypothetical protein QOG23_3465 [Blastocatellia bacterium]|jgi:hypothetical protein|nr:hypothetical protein [Blastocatellia bacterium]